MSFALGNLVVFLIGLSRAAGLVKFVTASFGDDIDQPSSLS